MFRDRARALEIGGRSKKELLSSLHKHGVGLNRYAHILFDDPEFATSDSRRQVSLAEVAVAELGLLEGATSAEIFAKAECAGLALCPLELAPPFRLQRMDQTEGPYLTVASKKNRDDEPYPNGFYLRRVDGVFWLRGYRAASDHIWEPSCKFAFLAS